MAELRLPLAQAITTRDGTGAKDSLMGNMIKEEQPGKVEAIKRPGTSVLYSLGAGAAQGTFKLKGVNYSIIGNVLRNVVTGASFVFPGPSPAGLIFDSVSDVTFGMSTIAFLKTTAAAYTFDGTTIVQVVDANYPAATTRGLTLLDGTYYVMTPGGLIYGSALQDPTTWSALNFIGADQSLGVGQNLFHHLNYAFAFCSDGIQAFYDNANPPPGSPLSPAGNATYRVGLASASSVVNLADMTIFLSKSAFIRGRSISALSGLSLITLSSPFVDKILNRSNLSNVIAFGISSTGHSFYVLTLVDIGATLVCDLLSKEWYVWTSTVGSVQNYFQFGYYLSDGTHDLLQHLTDGTVQTFDPTVYQDNGLKISCTIVTVPYDGGTTGDKFFSSLNLIGDTAPTNVSVRYSDDDYQTWNNYRNVDMSSKRKQLRSLGKSRRRAFQLLHEDNTALRLEAMEFDLNLGNS